MSNGSCLFAGGDYCVYGDGALHGSRGASIPMSASELEAMIESGAMSNVFDLDDLNAPNFTILVGEVFQQSLSQSRYADCKHYYKDPRYENPVGDYGNGTAVTKTENGFEIIKDYQPTASCTECAYGDFDKVASEIEQNTAPIQQGSYDNINENINAAKDYVKDTAGENVNTGMAMRNAEEAYESASVSSSGEIIRPDDMPGYDDLSPMDKIMAQAKYLDECQQQSLTIENTEELTPLSTSKAMRRFQ